MGGLSPTDPTDPFCGVRRYLHSSAGGLTSCSASQKACKQPATQSSLPVVTQANIDWQLPNFLSKSYGSPAVPKLSQPHSSATTCGQARQNLRPWIMICLWSCGTLCFDCSTPSSTAIVPDPLVAIVEIRLHLTQEGIQVEGRAFVWKRKKYRPAQLIAWMLVLPRKAPVSNVRNASNWKLLNRA